MLTLKIDGMTCHHCAEAVSRALSKVPGVTRVQSVDVARGEAILEGTPDEHAMIAAMREEGYEARTIREAS